MQSFDEVCIARKLAALHLLGCNCVKLCSLSPFSLRATVIIWPKDQNIVAEVSTRKWQMVTFPAIKYYFSCLPHATIIATETYETGDFIFTIKWWRLKMHKLFTKFEKS